MASTHFLEEALSSDPDETGMSAVVGSSVVLPPPPPAPNSLPVVTTSSVPVSGVGGTTTLSSAGPSPPTFINAPGGPIGATSGSSSSSFQILNMNGLRASMQPPGTPGNVQTVTTPPPGSPKTLAPRMILSPQMIGVRPPQPGGVHECSSEFNKSNNDNQKESTDSNTDAFETNECDDCILPTHIEDKAGLVEPLRASQSPTTQGTESEVLCLGEVKHHSLESQSLVSPYPTVESPVEPDLFSCDPNASPIMVSQARFQSDSSHCESPILNLDEHSHSDIIRFNSPENCTILTDECVQKTNEINESQSELDVTQSDQVNQSEHLSPTEDKGNAIFHGISGVQINDGLIHESASPNPTQDQFSPNSLCKIDRNHQSTTPTIDTNDNDEVFGLNQEQSSQIRNRESILVPTNTISISAQSKMQSCDALEETHLPSTTSAQIQGWARASTESTYIIRHSESQSNLNECQSVNIPDISHESIPSQPFRHSAFPSTDHQNFAQAAQFPRKVQLEIPQVSPIRHIQTSDFSPTSKPQSLVPQFSPNANAHPQYSQPQFSPTSQPQPQFSPSFHPQPQFSPSSHPQQQYSSSQHHPQYQTAVPQYSPTTQPRSAAPLLSPSHTYPQVHQFSPNLPSPQLSPNAQTYSHFTQMSKDRQYSPNSGQIQPSSHFPPGAHPYSTDRRLSSTSHHFPPSSQRFMRPPMDSPSQRQVHGQIFVPPSHIQPGSQISHFRQPSSQMPSALSPQTQLSPIKIPYGYPEPSQRSPISPQYKNLSGSAEGQPNPKCFTTDAQLQSQYLHYNQAHPVRPQGNKEAQLSPSSSLGHNYHLSPGLPSGSPIRTGLPHHPQSQQPNFPINRLHQPGLTPRAEHVQPSSCRMTSERLLSTSVRSQQGSHLYDHQVTHVRPNLQLQHSPTSGAPYNGQSSPKWPSVQNSGSSAGVNLPNPHDLRHGYSGSYTAEHTHLSVNPHANNPIRIQGQSPYVRASNNSIHQVRPQPERQYPGNFSQVNINVNKSHSISGNLGSVRPFAQSSTTHAQFSSQYNQYRPENDMSNIYYRGQHHNVLGNNTQNQMGSSSSSGSYPVICRVSPIRNRLESNVKSSSPYHPYQKLSQNPYPSQEYSRGPRTQVMDFSLYQHDQYNERMRRLSTQFTLQALPRLPPGAQGGPHLLVKTESGQYQLVRFGMPAPALTARTGTPLPPHPTSPLTVPNSIPSTPSSPSIVTAMTTSNNAQLTPSPSPALNALVSTSSSSVTTTTILGGLVQSQVIVTQPPLPGPVQTPSNVNFRSTNSPRPTTPVIISSSTSSANSNNTTVSCNNPSAPSQVSTGSPTLATTTTTYRLQTVPPVPPTAASNSNGMGMTASMSMQQQMHLPQVPPHSQALPNQAPSVLTSNNSTSTTASTVSQMTPDTAKTKCKNFLSFLLELSAKQNQTVAKNVKALIQGLVDGKVNAEDFSDRLQKEVNSQPQPCLVGFLKKSLPPLRHSLATKELIIDGIRAPLLTSLPSGVPATPVTALIPQNQVRSPVPTTPVKIITPISSSPSQPSAPIPRSTVAAVQQRFATPTKSPSSKASKAASSASSPTTQSHPSKGSGPSSKSTPKEKGDKKAFASSSNAGYSGDDDINDVAAMGGVNLAEESQRILGSTELIGTQIRSCKDEASLPAIPLQAKIKAIAAKHGLDEPGPEVAALISHALEERLKTLLEKLSVVAEHRLDVIKLEERYEVVQDIKGQLRFLEDLEKLERKRHDEQEREMLIRAAKSRSKSEDPEQAKLKAKAKEMQRVALEEMRQREANMTALQAIGPRKKPKLDTPTGSQSTSSLTPQSSLGASNSLNRPQMAMRPRLKRVSLRDLMFLLEQEKETSRSHFLYKHLLLK